MRAIVWTNYGLPDVLKLAEVEKPIPKDNEVLIKVYATTVTAGDAEARALKFPIWLWLPMRLYIGLRKPTRIRVLGQELAGEIEATGKDVTQFKVGDQIFAVTGVSMGAYAEYKCLPEGGVLSLKPNNMTFNEAATIPTGGLEALYFLRKAMIKPGERVLINGAAGSIGTAAIQLAKHFGAHITAVDSTDKLTMLRLLGADEVIDYTQEDFTKKGQTYDVIFDVVGKSSYSRSLASLTPQGRYLLANPNLLQMFRGLWTSRSSSKQVIIGTASQKAEALLFLKELIEAGELKTVIDRRYPLEQTAEAHRYVETGQKMGNVVLSVS